MKFSTLAIIGGAAVGIYFLTRKKGITVIPPAPGTRYGSAPPGVPAGTITPTIDRFGNTLDPRGVPIGTILPNGSTWQGVTISNGNAAQTDPTFWDDFK